MSSNSILKMEPGAEKTRRLMIFFVFFVLFFLGSVLFVTYLFNSFKDKVYKDSIKNAKMNSSLRDLRLYEKEQLENYGYVDKDKGVVRIPIDKAMQKVIRSYQR